MTNETTHADLVIIGAGPAGLYAAYYAGFRGLKTVVIDSLDEIGGQISAMYPEKLIHDVAGTPAIRGQDLVDALRRQADEYSPTYVLGTKVVDLEDVEDGLLVHTTTDTSVRTRAVLVCAGTGGFTPRPLPAAAGFTGTGIDFFAARLEDFRDQSVVIVGGGDSAVDWALALEGIAGKVRIVHRRRAFRAHEASVARLQESSVELLVPYSPISIGGTGHVESVTVRNEEDGTESTIEADRVIAALGFVADIGAMKNWGMNLEGHKILIDRSGRTGRDRVFAAGDITTYEGKVRLIAVGFGEVATAVNHIAHELNPQAPLFPGHSTDPH